MAHKASKDIDHEVSKENVYADLGFADSAEMLAKARIVSQIGRVIQERKLTQVQAALTKLGMDVEIVVRPRAKKRQSEGVVSVVFA